MSIVIITFAVIVGLCVLFVLLLCLGGAVRCANPDLVAAEEAKPWDR